MISNSKVEQKQMFLNAFKLKCCTTRWGGGGWGGGVGRGGMYS
jgi:hypothetical protein